eukprot:97459-Chlamydomonas_euryale.AAC.2
MRTPAHRPAAARHMYRPHASHMRPTCVPHASHMRPTCVPRLLHIRDLQWTNKRCTQLLRQQVPSPMPRPHTPSPLSHLRHAHPRLVVAYGDGAQSSLADTCPINPNPPSLPPHPIAPCPRSLGGGAR